MKPLRTPSRRGEERMACRGDQSHRPFEIGQSRERVAPAYRSPTATDRWNGKRERLPYKSVIRRETNHHVRDADARGPTSIAARR
jgi:hypothetical protein